MKNPDIKEKLDAPEEIIEGLFKEREKLLSGFFGFTGSNKKLLDESIIPSHVAISLAGEPTIYKYLPEMIKYLKKKKEIKSIFLVTNGQEPGMLKRLIKERALPTQLYLSIVASDKEALKKINRPKTKNAWGTLLKFISIFSKTKTRRVIRFTLIKGINDNPLFIKKYIKLFEKSNADFLEIKAYMYLGESRNNLKIDNMPSFTDVFEYAQMLERESKLFKVIDDVPQSRIVLLKNKKSKYSKYIK
jgi:tRNA wybutosine-synthesizing protein 1